MNKPSIVDVNVVDAVILKEYPEDTAESYRIDAAILKDAVKNTDKETIEEVKRIADMTFMYEILQKGSVIASVSAISATVVFIRPVWVGVLITLLLAAFGITAICFVYRKIAKKIINCANKLTLEISHQIDSLYKEVGAQDGLLLMKAFPEVFGFSKSRKEAIDIAYVIGLNEYSNKNN